MGSAQLADAIAEPSSRSGCTRDRWSGPWPALKVPKVETRNDIDDTSGGGSDVVDGYEQLRARALCGDTDGWRLGLGVLQQRGVAAWLRVRQATVADGLAAHARPGRVAHRRGRGRRAGRAAGLDGAGRRHAGVSGGERADRGEGDRRAPGPHRLPVRAPVHAAAGADQHRVRRPPIRVAAEGDRAGLGGRARSSPSTPTRASPAPRPPTGKDSSAWSPRSAWAAPGSCWAWRSPGWPATTPTGTDCWRSAPCRAR